MPLFNLLVPPETEKNPYTGEPMKRQMIPFPEGGQVNKQILKKWLTSHLPDNTLKISSKAQLDKLLNQEDDINKVLLLTSKAAPANVFKAVAAEFRNKLRFYVVSLPEGASKDLLAI